MPVVGARVVMLREAEISADERYRYLLRREWMPGDTFGVIMLNPSTADAQRDDPTIRRLIGFAGSNGCGSLLVANLFALRATDPQELLRADDPVGPGNDQAIIDVLASCKVVIAAWGTFPKHGSLHHRTVAVSLLATQHDTALYCLGHTAEGYPRHPLYLRSDQELLPYQSRPKRVPS